MPFLILRTQFSADPVVIPRQWHIIKRAGFHSSGEKNNQFDGFLREKQSTWAGVFVSYFCKSTPYFAKASHTFFFSSHLTTLPKLLPFAQITFTPISEQVSFGCGSAIKHDLRLSKQHWHNESQGKHCTTTSFNLKHDGGHVFLLWVNPDATQRFISHRQCIYELTGCWNIQCRTWNFLYYFDILRRSVPQNVEITWKIPSSTPPVYIYCLLPWLFQLLLT